MKIKILLLTSIFILISNNLFSGEVIGVTTFNNLTRNKQYAWLQIGIAETISFKLKEVREYTVIERTNVDRVIKEIEMGQSGLVDENSAKKAGKALNADLLVIGSFQIYGKNIRMSAKIVHVESHKVLKQVQETGKMDSIFELQDKLALKIIKGTDVDISKETKKRIIKNYTKNLSAYEYYIKGQKYLLSQIDYKKAIKMFHKAVKIDDRYSLAYAGLAKAYSLRHWELRHFSNITDKSVFQKSYIYSKKALEISPNLDEAHLALGKYYQEADIKKIPNKWDLCEKSAKKAIELNPNNADAYFLLSRRFGYDDKLEMKYLKLTIKKNRFITDAHNNLGFIYLQRNQYDLAIKYFENAIEIDPGYKLGYMNLGVVYERKKQYKKALVYYKKILVQYPNYVKAIINLGIGYRNLKMYDDALKQFEKATKVKPKSAKAWSERAYIYLLRNKYSTAIGYYKTAYRQDPNYYYTLANLGYSYSKTGEYDLAEKYLKKAHYHKKNRSWPAGHLGWMFRYKVNDKEKAIYWYKKASQRDPDNSKYSKYIMELSN